MTTEKQIAANRENAKKSTGPRTDAGKHRVSRNGLKHGNKVYSNKPQPGQEQLVRNVMQTSAADIDRFARYETQLQRIFMNAFKQLMAFRDRLETDRQLRKPKPSSTATRANRRRTAASAKSSRPTTGTTPRSLMKPRHRSKANLR